MFRILNFLRLNWTMLVGIVRFFAHGRNIQTKKVLFVLFQSKKEQMF